jgi:hypothetical protein
MSGSPTTPASSSRTATGDLVLLLDPSARAGRTGHRLRVKDARTHRAQARHALGVGRDELPTTVEILRAAGHLSRLLADATEGDAKLVVELGGECVSPTVVLSTLVSS